MCTHKRWSYNKRFFSWIVFQDCFLHLMFSGSNYIAACIISTSCPVEQWCPAWLETHSVYSCVSWWAFGLFPAYTARSFVLGCIFETFIMAITSATPVLSFTASKACVFAVNHQIAVVLHLHSALRAGQRHGPSQLPGSSSRHWFWLFPPVAQCFEWETG